MSFAITFEHHVLFSDANEGSAPKRNSKEGDCVDVLTPALTEAWKLDPKEVKKDKIKVFDEEDGEWVKELAKPLGRGTFGTVYRGKYKLVDVAIKEVSLGSEKECLAFHREVRILGMLSHPNITTFFGGLSKGDKGGIVLELFACSVGKALYFPSDCPDNVTLDAALKETMARALIDALVYLHGSNPKVMLQVC